MTRNEELATAFEAAAKAASPYYQQHQQFQAAGQDMQPVMNVDLAALREAAIVSRVLAAIGAVYRKAAEKEKV